MRGETDLSKMLAGMEPVLNEGVYVFCSVKDSTRLLPNDLLLFFKEEEGYTLVLRKEKADELGFSYQYEAAWISLKIHSALEAVGLTAAFAAALAAGGVSCNVVAAYYHDHIFVHHSDAQKAMHILQQLARQHAAL